MRFFSIYLYITAGKACYEVISENLRMPKANTIVKHIYADKDMIIEGELRCEKLSKHLERTNSPRAVFLSEDGSGVVKKVVYDCRTDQMVGIVLPYNETNGMPRQFTFQATSEENIKKYMELSQSTHVYIIVAQPLGKDSPSFILQMYGTDNQFKANHVLRRWRHIVGELRKYNIEVVGFSADGDARLLKSMQSITIFDLSPDVDIENRSVSNPVCVQDTIHIGTKMRNRLLNSSLELQLGNSVATTVHIKILLNTVDKEVHGLVQSDIYPQDRQNYKSLEKIMHDRVINALESSVPDCKGTIAYLKLCKLLTSSFVEENLNPIERIYRIWNGLYILRCWRNWIKKSKRHNLAENFISHNAYICAEINAHAIIDLILKLRSTPNMFLTPYFASQPCESFFRLMRSLGTQNYTKINFSFYELLHLTAKVELMNKIAFSCPDIVFPRIKSKLEPRLQISQNLPSNEEIKDTMKRSLQNALQTAEELGMKLSENDIKTCEVRLDEKLMDEIMAEEEEEEENYENLDENEKDMENESASPSASHRNIEASIEVIDADGTARSIAKSTLIWMLTESKGKLSSDRLKRVQASTSSLASPTSKRAKLPSTSTGIFKSDQLQIGQWTIFKTDSTSSETFEDSTLNSYFICFITGFRIVDSTRRRKQYKLHYVPIGNNLDEKTAKKMRLVLGNDYNFENIEVLAVLYNCNKNGFLHPKQRNEENEKSPFTLKLQNYYATMDNPIAKRNDNSDSLLYSLPCEYTKFINLLEKKSGS